MIEFHNETDFNLDDENRVLNWIQNIAKDKGFEIDEINYIFCNDEYLHKLNVQFLNHDTLTDIISFDNSLGKTLSGDIFISVDRVTENAKEYGVDFDNELHRVIIHGLLHFMGFKDKTDEESKQMRIEENNALELISI